MAVITADGDYSHAIKRRLPLGRKVMTNLDSIFKSRDITLVQWLRFLPLIQEACVQSLVKELRPHMLCGMAKRFFKIK